MDKLLELLNENARYTNAQLSAMLGEPKEDIEKRIKKYEKQGVIKGYKTIINWEMTDFERLTAIIELKVSPKKNIGFEEIAETVMRFDEVESVYLMSGGYDLMVMVTGKSFQEIAMFVAKRLAPLDSVLSTATHFLLRRYKQDGVILHGEPVDERRNILL